MRVHLRCFYFFLCILLVIKIAYVIRSFVKSRLEPEPEPGTHGP